MIVNRYFFSFQFSSIRGALVSTVVVSGHIGVVLSFILGAYSEYISYPILAIALTLLFDVIFIFFPETPIFLLKQNKIAVSFRPFFSMFHTFFCNEIVLTSFFLTIGS